MKTIKNDICSALQDEKGKDVTYSQMCILCLNQPKVDPNGREVGYLPDEMRKRIALIDSIEEAKEEMKIEDADAALLLECVRTTKWRKLDKAIVKFIDDIEESLS